MRDHKYFYVTVADLGMGILKILWIRIFERFYRVDKSHSREIGGTGLGLAITRSTIAMHHGVIKVFSREGEGTTFSVRIPRHIFRRRCQMKKIIRILLLAVLVCVAAAGCSIETEKKEQEKAEYHYYYINVSETTLRGKFMNQKMKQGILW